MTKLEELKAAYVAAHAARRAADVARSAADAAYFDAYYAYAAWAAAENAYEAELKKHKENSK